MNVAAVLGLRFAPKILAAASGKSINEIVVPKAKAGEISSVVLDTGSEVAARMEGAFDKQFKDGRQVYQALSSTFVELIDTVIKLGIWFVMICHETPPEMDKTGQKLRGGPLMPGKKLPRRLPPKFDLVLRAAAKADSLGGEAKRVYECNPLSGDYIMKDRFGVTLKEQPMELAPIVFRIMNPGQPVPQELLQKQLKLVDVTG